jgi:hypothetical protein
MSDGMDFYDLLGVGPEASTEEIKRAFRRQVREYHPDLNDDPRAPAQFTALKKAYDTLADDTERNAYDRLGHDEYVSERISGLPSVDHWQSPDADDGVDSDPDPDPGGSNGTGAGHADDPADAAEWSADDAESADFDFDFDFEDVSTDGVGTGTGAGGTQGSGGAVGADSGSSVDGFVVDAPDETGGLGDAVEVEGEASTVTKSPTASGAGTARGPKTAPDTAGTADSTTADTTVAEEYVETDTAASDAGPSRSERVRGWFRWLVGWPLVGLADALYLVTLAVYVSANATGFGTLADRALSDGLTGGLLASRYGIEGLPALVTGAGATPAYGPVAAVGLVTLPTVYLLLVRWTRRNRRPWQPSYLYAVGAAAPLVGVVAATVAPPSGLALDLVAYVAVPLVTMAAMVFFGQLLPRLRRLVRRYVYRLSN